MSYFMIRFLRTALPRGLKGTALVRLDFNTEDEWRMQATLPTVRLLLRRADKVVIMSHRGRPSFVPPVAGLRPGKPKGFDKKLSLRNDARILGRLLRRQVVFIPHLRFRDIGKHITRAPKGSLFLLENLRFVKGEENNAPQFARGLASLGDYYVNDAFAVSHRDDASVDAITRYLPSYGGLELEKEIQFLSRLLQKPKRPFVVVLGGGKARDKLGVITRFLKIASSILLGGAAGNTILMLQGVNVLRSVVATDPADLKKLKKLAWRKNIVTLVDGVLDKGKLVDIGPKTTLRFSKEIRRARTIVWSGPMGVIEERPFDRGTLAVAKAIASNRRAYTVAGGGETVMFLKQHRLDKKFTFISTGGGAMVDFLAGEKLPGIAALERRASPSRPAFIRSGELRTGKREALKR